jgi:1-deoxy-D-xylulose-5-phosphate synthase
MTATMGELRIFAVSFLFCETDENSKRIYNSPIHLGTSGLLAQLAAEHELVVTVEEGVLMGGFGSAVLEVLSDGGVAPRMLRVGMPDRYVTHGAPKLLHEEVGYTPERIAERIESAVLEGRPTAAR